MTQDVKEMEAYFRNLNNMLRSEGWQLFTKELLQLANQVNSVELTKDANDLYFRKGQLAILANVLNFETQVAAAQEQFESEQNESN